MCKKQVCEKAIKNLKLDIMGMLKELSKTSDPDRRQHLIESVKDTENVIEDFSKKECGSCQ